MMSDGLVSDYGFVVIVLGLVGFACCMALLMARADAKMRNTISEENAE